MAFANKIGNLFKQVTSSGPSMYHSIRCMSSSKVFVGGISYNTDDQSLREAFRNYGEVVEARIIMDRETGRSRGFGFVTFASTYEVSWIQEQVGPTCVQVLPMSDTGDSPIFKRQCFIVYNDIDISLFPQFGGGGDMEVLIMSLQMRSNFINTKNLRNFTYLPALARTKLPEDSRKYGVQNTCTSGSTLSKAALCYGRARAQMEKERGNLLKTLGTQV